MTLNVSSSRRSYLLVKELTYVSCTLYTSMYPELSDESHVGHLAAIWYSRWRKDFVFTCFSVIIYHILIVFFIKLYVLDGLFFVFLRIFCS